MTDEEFVRRAWSQVGASEGPCVCVVYHETGSTDLERSIRGIGQGATMEDAWAAARAFTEERLGEIRQIDKEIALTKLDIDECVAMGLDRIRYDRESTLQRLQSIRADLVRGMKAPQ